MTPIPHTKVRELMKNPSIRVQLSIGLWLSIKMLAHMDSSDPELVFIGHPTYTTGEIVKIVHQLSSTIEF